MMDGFSGKTFRLGDGVALCLPKEVAFAPDTPVVIERNGEVLTIRPSRDAAEEKRKVLELVAALRALPQPEAVEKREKIIMPARRGL